MTTTIAPSAGQSPEYLQLGPGAANLYGALDLRRSLSVGLQEGVTGPAGTAYKVTLSAGMNLTIAASSDLGALVQGDSITAQGLYYVPPHNAAIIETVSAAHATLPRIDQVVLEVLDAAHDGGASNLARTRIVAGTATSGATLDNRTGAAALPITAIRLADVLVPAAAASILAGNIRDRRLWAAGAYRRIVRNTGSPVLNTAGTSFALVDSVNLQPRIECSGVVLNVKMLGRADHNTAGALIIGQPWQDGVVCEATGGDMLAWTSPSVSASEGRLAMEWEWPPAAGSHLLGFAWRTTSGTASLNNAASLPLVMTVQEIVRPSAENT